MIFNLVQPDNTVYEFSDTYLNEWEKEAKDSLPNTKIASTDAKTTMWSPFKDGLVSLGFKEKDGVLVRNHLSGRLSTIDGIKHRIIFERYGY